MNLKDYAKKYNGTKSRIGKWFCDVGEIEIVPSQKNDPEFAYYYTTHYPDSRGIVGRQFNYKIYKDGLFAGIIGANSPFYQPGGYLKFNDYFDIEPTSENYKLFLNNNVYRLIVNEPNLGTRVLKAFREKIYEDYHEEYGQFLIGLVTFVEPPRDGTVYKADNWDHLGMTVGWEIKGREIEGMRVVKNVSVTKTPMKTGNKKYIYAMKFPERYKNRIQNHLSTRKNGKKEKRKKKKTRSIDSYF